MTTPSIGLSRAMAKRELDLAAAAARMAHQTLTPGQEMVYAAKLAQAQAYDPTPLAAPVPARPRPEP